MERSTGSTPPSLLVATRTIARRDQEEELILHDTLQRKRRDFAPTDDRPAACLRERLSLAQTRMVGAMGPRMGGTDAT